MLEVTLTLADTSEWVETAGDASTAVAAAAAAAAAEEVVVVASVMLQFIKMHRGESSDHVHRTTPSHVTATHLRQHNQKGNASNLEGEGGHFVKPVCHFHQITEAIKPAMLEVVDESTLHAEHEAMRNSGYNETHFKVLVVADAFKGKVIVAH